MIVGRPLRAMFVHKVRELGVLRLLSVRIEVVADLVHVHGELMFSWFVAVMYISHESGRLRRDDFGYSVYSDHFVVTHQRVPCQKS